MLFIVAISLVALIGMLVLTVDLGSLYAERRVMVRAADSAVLAAAQQCVRTGSPGSGGNPDSVADSYAEAPANAGPTATGGLDPSTQNCNNGYLTVSYSIQKSFFFAPIFGFNTGTVSAQATAAWTLPGLMPLTISKTWDDQTVVDCTPPRTPGSDFLPGQECYVLFDNKVDDTQNWGWLDLPNWWGYPDTVDLLANTCSGNADLRNEVMNGLTYSQVSFPTPAWACNKSGNNSNGWLALTDPSLWGTKRAFPISDRFCNKDSSDPQCSGQTFRHIIGFQTAMVIGAWGGPNAATCGPRLPAPTNNQTCVHLRWEDARVNSIDVVRLVK